MFKVHNTVLFLCITSRLETYKWAH